MTTPIALLQCYSENNKLRAMQAVDLQFIHRF